MAISLRRALISSKNFSSAIRIICSRSYQSSSHLNSYHFYQSAEVDNFIHSPATQFHQFDTRRGFAKARKQKIVVKQEEEDSEDEESEEDSEDEESEEGGDIGATVKASASSQMEAAVESLSRELAKLRTGRASAGMLDHIMVEHYGSKTPLHRVAVVSVADSKTLSVTPYDANALKEIEKSIVSSPLGLNPKPDSQRLIVPIPALTKEHMQAVCKVVAKSAEDVKQSIRRARQKALDNIKKAAPKKKDKDKSSSSITADDAKRLEKEIDDITKKFIKSAEEMCKSKEKEILAGG